MEDRIIRLEETQKHHADEIKELKASNIKLVESFNTLITSLTAIKNWVIGGVAFAVIQQIGLIEVIKKVLF